MIIASLCFVFGIVLSLLFTYEWTHERSRRWLTSLGIGVVYFVVIGTLILISNS